MPKSICNPRRTELLRRLSLDCISATESAGVAAQHQQLTIYLKDLHTVSPGLMTAEKTSWLCSITSDSIAHA
ncbi:hypothetical protein HBI56_001450 [Parastagonospora nodorum]|nr:hypothetical protein HBH52_150480 [Parastagonospora nodorum]KAH3983496.1 hypothetical protein HBH51_033390 [Parastagonospora nodorum]KAH4032776.1 hypothetical protein HBI13_001860 [Parastagonospora nodorum]KAH4041582.1 hypothetical protein HBI09_001780 [Parastagonospora nodorum]KAH4099039.1 hypothetical protein HBH48_001870 [Parastagonospora nodorum]